MFEESEISKRERLARKLREELRTAELELERMRERRRDGVIVWIGGHASDTPRFPGLPREA